MAEVLKCDIVVSEFELQLNYYINFGALEKIWTT